MPLLRIPVRAILIPLVAVLFLALPAQAALKWCKTDPVATLNDREYQVLVSIPEEYVPLVNGPIDVEYRIPESTKYKLLFTDAGYNGYGEVVTFKGIDANNRYEFAVRIPLDESQLADGVKVPMLIEVIEKGGSHVIVKGTTDGTTASIATASGSTDEED